MHGRPIRSCLDHEAVRATNQREKDSTIEEQDKEHKKRMTQKREGTQVRIERLRIAETERRLINGRPHLSQHSA